jgi:integrase
LRVVQRGAVETAHRLKDACGQVFRYGVANSLCERNPVADLQGRAAAGADPPPGGHDRSRPVAQLLRDLPAATKANPSPGTRCCLSALLFLRPGELRHLEWAWIDWDGASLTVPSSTDEAQQGREGHRQAALGAAGIAGPGRYCASCSR